MKHISTFVAAGLSVAAIGLTGTALAQDIADDLNRQALEGTDPAPASSSSGMNIEMPDQDRHIDRSALKNMSWEEQKKVWDMAAQLTLNDCIHLSDACRVATDNSVGVLIFPELTSAGFLVGGTGGRGVLMIDGEPVGYYDLAAGSLGFQAGIEKVSQVMAFQSERALNDLMMGPEWRTGAGVGVTVLDMGANADAIADGDLDQLGDVTSITFNEGGFAGGVSLESVRISEVTAEGKMAF